MYNLRDYQISTIEKIEERIKTKRRIIVQLPTGAGKTVIFSHFVNTNKHLKILILVHRVELLEQTLQLIPNATKINAKTRELSDNTVYIGMVETMYSRLKRNPRYVADIDLIITDEAHILCFEKVWDYFDKAKVIGFSATPIVNKTKTVFIDDVEFTEPFTLSEIYDDIIVGVPIQKLIDDGFLVQDMNVVLDVDISGLEESATNPDGYTTASMNKVYNNTLAMNTLLSGYEKYARGKKTLIFNSTTKNNEFVNAMFLLNGYNSRAYDSVNNSTSERAEIVEWFLNTPDAILCNVGVFTTGFDVPDVEVIILNKATQSLSLYIQMVGRGSRIAKNIFKDKFIVIDGGSNISRFGRWSSNFDWEAMFYPQEKMRKRKRDLLQVWECKKCGALNVRGETTCSECGAEKPHQVRKLKKGTEGEFVVIDSPPIPSGKKIVRYAEINNEGSSFAFRLLEQQIMDLFIFNNVSREDYKERIGKYKKRVIDIYRPAYFEIIKSDLQGANKRFQSQLERMLNKIDNHFNQ